MKKFKKLLTAALLLGALASCGETPVESSQPSVEESTEIRELDAALAKIAEGKTCYLTTTGQADLDTVNNLFKLSGVASSITKEALLEASDVAEGSVVF